MNEEMLNYELKIAKERNNFLPFFENAVSFIQKIEEIEKPYIFFSKGHECIELEFEKMLNKKESNYISIDFYENEIEIYMTKYRKDKTIEYPTDLIVLKYDEKSINFINTVCLEFLNDKSNKIYEVKNV